MSYVPRFHPILEFRPRCPIRRESGIDHRGAVRGVYFLSASMACAWTITSLSSVETLLRISDEIENETPVGSVKKCKGCGKEGEPDKTTLPRCSRCLGVLLWKAATGARRNLQWIAFGQREEPPLSETSEEPEHFYRPEWRNVQPAVVQELQGTFTVSSGKLGFKCMHPFLTSTCRRAPLGKAGVDLITTAHDCLTTEDRTVASGTVMTQGSTFRAPAQTGVWKSLSPNPLAKVNGFGHADAPKDSWLACHSSCDPLELLLLARPVSRETRANNRRVCRVNRYDWGYHCADAAGAACFFVDIDPDSGWGAANERQRRLDASDKYRRNKDPDNERWERWEGYDSHNTCLVDASHGPGRSWSSWQVLRPSKLNAQLDDDKSSSFFNGGVNEESFVCKLAFLGEGWEYALLIFGKEES
ncbi:hypothetical protein DFH07DRAFT_1031635 [Mycena maculata]|uniref:Uncharacterized protein n=1 Tax=Mycena maculata TaxID=230809 RepID=A0AAD7NB69_9AGAR|nr:hypothetical protein DFH07DRAFT_1031635 [Mycena maculata]